MIHATRWESVVQVWLGEKININYTYIGELSKLNAQVSLSHQCLPIALTGNFFFFFKAHTCFISNWPLTLMHAASRENRRQVCLVTMLHEASEKGFFLQSHRIRWVLASRVCAPQLGLIYATDKAVSLQHSTLWGSSRETAFQFISDGPSPGPHFRVFKAIESIDQHLKLGPTPLSQLRGYGDLASFLAPSPHYSFWPPALLVMVTLWYNYD